MRPSSEEEGSRQPTVVVDQEESGPGASASTEKVAPGCQKGNGWTGLPHLLIPGLPQV